MPSSAPPSILNFIPVSNKISRKCVHFLTYVSIILAEMSLGYTSELHPDANISPAAWLLLTAPCVILHLGTEIRSLGQIPLHFPLTLSQTSNLPFCILNVSNPLLSPTVSVRSFSFIVSSCLFPLNGRLPWLQRLPLQSIFLTETKLNLFKHKRNMSVFLAKIQMGSNSPQFWGFPLTVWDESTAPSVCWIASPFPLPHRRNQAVRSFPGLPSGFSPPCDTSKPHTITSLLKCTGDYFRECSRAAVVKTRR